MAKNAYSVEAPPLPGHETLTMADQMRARGIPATVKTSPVTGAVENQRRKHMQNMIQAKASKAEKAEEAGEY